MDDRYQDLKREIWCLKKAIEEGGGGGGTTNPFPSGRVANYSSLPDPSTVDFKYYYVQNSQGNKWLPGSLGGDFYPRGFYYSNGLTWTLIADIPYEATQLEVDTGTVSDKFVTPETLSNSTQWDTKVSSVTGSSVDNTDPLNPVVNAIGGYGSSGRVSFWNDTYSLSSNSFLFWDDSNKRLGIGIGTPTSTLDIKGEGSTSSTSSLSIQNSSNSVKLSIKDDGLVQIGRNETYSTVQSFPLVGNMAIIKPVDSNPIGLMLDIPYGGFFATSNVLVSGNAVPRGFNSIDIQIGSYGATGESSVVVGTGLASGDYSYVFGSGTASGSKSCVIGSKRVGSLPNSATGYGSLSIHNNNVVASGKNSTAINSTYSNATENASLVLNSNYGEAYLPGQHLTNFREIDGLSSNENNLFSRFVFTLGRAFSVTSGGPLNYDLYLPQNNANSTTQKATIQPETVWNVRLDIVAQVAHDGSGGGYIWGHGWAASYQFAIRRAPTSDTVSLLGTVDTIMSPKFDASLSGCTATITADDTNKALSVVFNIPSNADVAARFNVNATAYVTQTRAKP